MCFAITHTADIFPSLFFCLLKPISVYFTHIIANVLSLYSFLHIRSYFWDCFLLSEACVFRTSLKGEKSLFSLVWKYIDFFLVVEKCSCWVYNVRLTVTFSPYIKATPALSFGFYFVAEKLAISVLICLRKVPYLWLLLRSSFNLWCSIVLLWCMQM